MKLISWQLFVDWCVWCIVSTCSWTMFKQKSLNNKYPSLWLNILSKLISPVFSRYLIMTERTLGSGRIIFLLALKRGGSPLAVRKTWSEVKKIVDMILTKVSSKWVATVPGSRSALGLLHGHQVADVGQHRLQVCHGGRWVAGRGGELLSCEDVHSNLKIRYNLSIKLKIPFVSRFLQ